MNNPKNFDDFRKHQAENERTFDLYLEMLKEHDAKLDSHTKMLVALQSDVSSIKSTVETRLVSIETMLQELLKRIPETE